WRRTNYGKSADAKYVARSCNDKGKLTAGGCSARSSIEVTGHELGYQSADYLEPTRFGAKIGTGSAGVRIERTANGVHAAEFRAIVIGRIQSINRVEQKENSLVESKIDIAKFARSHFAL